MVFDQKKRGLFTNFIAKSSVLLANSETEAVLGTGSATDRPVQAFAVILDLIK